MMILTKIIHALEMALFMAWEIFWALILGFVLSAIIQALVSKKQMSSLLPDSSLKSLSIASGLGAASSSCSYAAIAITKSLIKKDANFIAAMAFQMASTNLVIELSILILLMLGWQFLLSEFLGAILLIIVMAFLFKIFVSKRMFKEARHHVEFGLLGKMEGHAAMDMSLHEGTFWQRFFSKKGLTAISHIFVMDWLGIWTDVVLGLLIAGFLAAFVPETFWTNLFLTSDPMLSKMIGPLVGPLIAIVSFVCSVGNVPLAAYLWMSGISFGGVIAFIFADLIIIPIIHIYMKYYGAKMAMTIFLIYYIAMVVAAYIIEFLFYVLNIIPTNRNILLKEMQFSFNYTAVLNIIFGIVLIFLIIWFFKSNGLMMLKMEKASADKDRKKPEQSCH